MSGSSTQLKMSGVYASPFTIPEEADFFDSKELAQCYQLQYDNIRKLPGFQSWKEKLGNANPQYILNTYVYLEVCNLPESIKKIMQKIFIRCKEDRTELK